MNVADIMVRDVFFAGLDTKVGEVAEILFQNRIHGLPVIENGKVAGIITEDDFYIKGNKNIFLPSYISLLKSVARIDKLPENINAELDRLLEAKASDIMTSDCVTVKQNMEADKLLSLIIETKFNTFPVTSEKGTLVGIVTLADVLSLVSRKNKSTVTALSAKSGRSREVDVAASDTRSFWERKIMSSEEFGAKNWQVVIISAFLAGLIVAIIWNISIRIQE
jgi:CBS-domain-containing membrane protein